MGQITPIGVFGALNATLGFEKMGPQSVRTVWIEGPVYLGASVRGNSGIKTAADLKGKKIPQSTTHDTLNNYVDAVLAFGGLTRNDVVNVKVTDFVSMKQSILDGHLDMAMQTEVDAKAYELEGSPGGIYWLPFPATDTAGWDRFHKINPTFFPYTITEGAGVSTQKPAQMLMYRYVIDVYDDTPDDFVYWFVRLMHFSYETYKKNQVHLVTYTIDAATNLDEMFAPYHPAAIQYFRDALYWTPAHDKKQAELLKKYPQTLTRPAQYRGKY